MIEELSLRKILNSRANYTVEAEVNGEISSAPSGASTGKHEAKCFVPDQLGQIETELEENLIDFPLDQKKIDNKLKEIDGSNNFAKLGAVAIATSMASKKAIGFSHSDKFPYPLSNLIGGGAHGGNTSIQEFLVLPLKAESFPEALETNAKIYKELKKRYQQKIMGINDEGALITRMNDEDTLKALKKVADKYGASIGLDVAASDFWDSSSGTYHWKAMDLELKPEQQVKYINKLIEKYDLVYVEDPVQEEDFENLGKIKKNNCLIVGDDTFVTNLKRLKQGIEQEAGNSLIIKPNQIGTISQAKETTKLANNNSYTPVLSHRSGTTSDPFLADLSLEWEIPIIKAGLADIRIAKLNKLLRLWYLKRESDREMNDQLDKVFNNVS